MLFHNYRAVFYPAPIMGPPSSRSPYTRAVTISKSLLSPSRVFQTASSQIAPEEANLPKPYSTFSQLRSSFCSSLRSYSKRIGLVTNPFCPSCGLEPYTTVHVLSCSLHPTSLTELNLRERPHLASEFMSNMPFFEFPPLPPPLEPSPYGRQESSSSSSS